MNLFNSMGNPWTADYLKITGELDVDLRSNIAAEARAKIVYERLINFCNDAGTKDALQFLMTREITHMKAFTAALESLGKPRFAIGRIAPTAGLVDQFFNDSTGQGDQGEIDARGPWNEGEEWEFIEAPAFQTSGTFTGTRRSMPAVLRASPIGRSASRYPARGKAARESAAEDGQRPLGRTPAVFEVIWRNRDWVERLNECFGILGTAARPARKGMMGRRGRRGRHRGEQEKGCCRRPRSSARPRSALRDPAIRPRIWPSNCTIPPSCSS